VGVGQEFLKDECDKDDLRDSGKLFHNEAPPALTKGALKIIRSRFRKKQFAFRISEPI
jgi:hypothetical protein